MMMKLRNQLLLAFTAMLVVLGLGLALGVVVVRQLSTLSENIVEGNLAAIAASSRMRSLVGVQHAELSRFLLEREDGQRSGEGLLALMGPFVEEARLALHEQRRHARGEDEQRAVSGSEQALAALAELTLAYIEAEADGGPRPTLEILEALNELRRAARLPYENNFEQLVNRSRRVAIEAGQLGLGLSLIAAALTVLGLLAALYLSRRLSRPLEAADLAMGRVGQGDYSVRLGRSDIEEVDRVSRGFNAMAESLQRFHAMRLDEIVTERHRLDTVIDRFDHGLILVDDQGRIERVNPVAARQLGMDAATLRGRGIDEVFAGSPLPGYVHQALQRADGDSSSGLDGQDLQRTVGGHERTLAWSLNTYAVAQHRGVVLMLRDVSRERELERMRTEFVLRAAHELRTPITGMRMAVGLLKDRAGPDADPREAELLDTLGNEMERTARLITNLLDLARVYDHGLDLDRVALQPADLLEQAADRFRERARAAGVGLRIEAEPALPEVHADRDQIDRVLDNLLSNALRHTPREGVVTLRARRLGNEMCLEVSDTGEGLDPELRERVFQPFVQVGRASGGTGIGLAMSREIAEQHGGRLQAKAANGGGGRFVLSLPL